MSLIVLTDKADLYEMLMNHDLVDLFDGDIMYEEYKTYILIDDIADDILMTITCRSNKFYCCYSPTVHDELHEFIKEYSEFDSNII